MAILFSLREFWMILQFKPKAEFKKNSELIEKIVFMDAKNGGQGQD